MGGLFARTEKTDEEIDNDIEQLNKITNSEIFYQKIKYKFEFIKKPSFFNSLLTGKSIVCEIVNKY